MAKNKSLEGASAPVAEEIHLYITPNDVQELLNALGHVDFPTKDQRILEVRLHQINKCLISTTTTDVVSKVSTPVSESVDE